MRKKWRNLTGFNYTIERIPSVVCNLKLQPSIEAYESYSKNNSFRFLNLQCDFDREINWDFAVYGKLWTYNLHYFEYLHQPSMEMETGVDLMHSFLKNLSNTAGTADPYPISLRILFWVRFFSQHSIQDERLDRSLYAQAYILADNLEYHILGNHLLENGFGLLFSAFRYQDTRLFEVAKSIIIPELNEQILPDGGHFERSPMYHQIILYRILDCYNLLKNNANISLFQDVGRLSDIIKEKAIMMQSWLHQMTYQDGTIPHFGDSTDGIAPSSNALFEYCKRLEIAKIESPLGASGYRKYSNNNFELIAKLGQLGPDYLLSHAHADSLTFELRIHRSAFLVDTGISTYEKNTRRQAERSTAGHNTVEVDGCDSSEVWAGFRVGKRANTTILSENSFFVKTMHDGYNSLNVTHTRTFSIKENVVEVLDSIGTNSGKFRLFFHPSIKISIENDIAKFNRGQILFNGFEKIELKDYDYCLNYNQILKGCQIIVTFKRELRSIIEVVM